jgi:hypothetical protein
MALPVALVLVLQATVAFTTVARGTDSQVSEPREVLARSADEWRALWSTHSAGRAPDLDISRFTVVGVFLGTRPTGGYEIEITRVLQEGAATVVEYRERRPPPDAFLIQALTSPFHIVRIPRTDAKIGFRRIDSGS